MDKKIESTNFFESEVFKFINLFRSKPDALLAALKERLPFYKDKIFQKKEKRVKTSEGVKALEYALQFAEARVKTNNRLAKLEENKQLKKCTEKFKAEVRKMKHIGHLSTDGTSLKQRIKEEIKGKSA